MIAMPQQQHDSFATKAGWENNESSDILIQPNLVKLNRTCKLQWLCAVMRNEMQYYEQEKSKQTKQKEILKIKKEYTGTEISSSLEPGYEMSVVWNLKQRHIL